MTTVVLYISRRRNRYGHWVCVLRTKPFFLPVDIQYTQCPRWFFILERCKFCGHKATMQAATLYQADSSFWVLQCNAIMLGYVLDVDGYRKNGLTWRTRTNPAPEPAPEGWKVSAVVMILTDNTLRNVNEKHGITGGRSNQDLIRCVKIGIYMGFCVHRGSWLLWPPVIINNSSK